MGRDRGAWVVCRLDWVCNLFQVGYADNGGLFPGARHHSLGAVLLSEGFGRLRIIAAALMVLGVISVAAG